MDILSLLPDAILLAPSDAIVALDGEGLIRFRNPGSTRIFGFGAEEAIGQSLDLIIPENLRARHWEGFRRVLKTGQSRYEANELLSVPALTKSGKRISVEFTIVMMRDCGTVVGMAAIIRDVTRHFEEVKALRRKIVEIEAAIRPVLENP